MSNMSFDTNSPTKSSLFEKTKIKKINEVSSSLSSIIKQSSQLTGENKIEENQQIVIKNEGYKQLNEREHKKNIPVSFQQTVNYKPPLYINKNTTGDKKTVILLKNKGLKLNNSFIDNNVNSSIIQSKYPQVTNNSLPIVNDVNNIKQNYLNIPTNNYENKQPLFPETNNHTKHHRHHHHRNKKIKEKRWGGGGGRSITLSLDGSEFIHKHNDNVIEPKEYINGNTKSENIDIVITEEKEDYSKVHPLSLIMENLSCYPSYNSYNSQNEKQVNKNTNPDLLSLKKDDAVAVQHFFPDGWAFGYHPASGTSGMFPIKCLKMAESGGTGIVIYPPTEADLLMTEIKDNNTIENEESIKDKDNNISEKKSDKDNNNDDDDDDNVNKDINIFNEMESQSKYNEINQNQDISFASPIPIPSSSKVIDYENSLYSSYFSSSTISNNPSSSSFTSSSTLSSSSLNSIDSNKAVFSPSISSNTEYNPNNPFSSNYKNRNYWTPESYSPQSIPSLLNYKHDKSFSDIKNNDILLSSNNETNNLLIQKIEKEKEIEKTENENKDEKEHEKEHEKEKEKENENENEKEIEIKIEEIENENENENENESRNINEIAKENKSLNSNPNTIDDIIDKTSYELSILEINRKQSNNDVSITKGNDNNEKVKVHINDNEYNDESKNNNYDKNKENNSNEYNNKNVKININDHEHIDENENNDKNKENNSNECNNENVKVYVNDHEYNNENENNDSNEKNNKLKNKKVLLPFAKPTIDTSLGNIKKELIIKPIISPSPSHEKALPIFGNDSIDDNLPVNNALPILSNTDSNSNELPLLSTRKRRRQRKDISDCNEFLKNRLLDPTLPLHIRKRYQYYIDNNL